MILCRPAGSDFAIASITKAVLSGVAVISISQPGEWQFTLQLETRPVSSGNHIVTGGRKTAKLFVRSDSETLVFNTCGRVMARDRKLNHQPVWKEFNTKARDAYGNKAVGVFHVSPALL